VHVRLEIPKAQVVIFEGVGTARLETTAPFVGWFESAGTSRRAGYRMEIRFDEASSKQLGSDRPVTIYARMSFGSPSAFAATQTLHLAPSLKSMQQLVSGELSEYFTYVTDEGKPIAFIYMRLQPF
jgi:hypothetical protein